MSCYRVLLALAVLWGLLVGLLSAGEADPFEDLDRPRPGDGRPSDPFADLEEGKERSQPVLEASLEERGFFKRNFGFKKEVYSQFTYSDEAPDERVYSRQSIGLEILKKFSTRTATVAAFNIQARLVRRDNYLETPNDGEGAEREGWFFEYHNLYWDFYNFLNPFLGAAKGAQVGRFNFRLGRYYLPFGLNLQTDTHGSLLQLSNERNFGFERDWYAGLWGAVNSELNYDAYYLLGSGYDFSFKGQKGLAAGRLSLANKYFIEHGLEGGIAFAYGERISKHGVERSLSVARDSEGNKIIDTLRGGLDWRLTRSVPGGALAWTGELSAGKDENDEVFTQLQQLGFLSRRRKWGLDLQYRRFWQNLEGMPPAGAPGMSHGAPSEKTDSSLIGEFSWYFRNDLGNTNLHWIKLNVEREVEAQRRRPLETKVTLQYYKYW